MLAAYAEADQKWRPIFDEEVEIVPFPAEQRAKLAEGAGEIWEEWVKQQEDAGRPGREILDFIKAEAAKYQ